MGFWVYVFQLGADVQLGTVTLAGAEPGPEHVVTLPVRQLDHYITPGMPLTELAGLLAAVAEDYPPTALTALLADSLTKGPRPVGRRPPQRQAHDQHPRPRPRRHQRSRPRRPRLAHRRRLPTPSPGRHGLARTRSEVNTMPIEDPTTATRPRSTKSSPGSVSSTPGPPTPSTGSPPASAVW